MQIPVIVMIRPHGQPPNEPQLLTVEESWLLCAKTGPVR
jgi:hypothetical protein